METDQNNPGSVADRYLESLADEPQMRSALLVCAADLRLDDATAVEAIRAVAPQEAAAEAVVWRLKKLSCVLPRWDGTWRLAEDVRPHLLNKLEQELDSDTVVKLRRRLAALAQQAAESCSPNGQITSYRKRQAIWEAAYQRTLIPDQMQHGVQQLVDVWREASGADSKRAATALAADYLATELQQRLKHLPAELLFLRGMAARSRGDRRTEESHFRAVWEQGKPGDIYGIAAHLFGGLVSQRDWKTAERAMLDSLRWYRAPHHRGQVLHSLGNLLSKQSQRWKEAENTYNRSLHLLAGDKPSQGKVWHSLGNLLNNQPQRWKEAEEAHRTSLKLNSDPHHQGEVWHSLGNLLSKQSDRWEKAEEAYGTSLKLNSDPHHQGEVYASWARAIFQKQETSLYEKAEEYALKALQLKRNNLKHKGIVHSLLARIYEATGQYPKAISSLEEMIQANRKLENWGHVADGKKRLHRLRKFEG